MSQCFRTISSKLPPFVGTRKQVTQLDRQLPKHIKSSTFLEEFLGTRNVLNSAVTLKFASNENVPFHLSFKNQSISSLDVPRRHQISLRQNAQKEVKIDKFKEFNELQRFAEPLSEIKSINASLEANCRINRQKTFARKQHRDVQEIQIKRASFTIQDHVNHLIPPDIDNSSVVLMSGALNPKENDKKDAAPAAGGKPSQEQLEKIYNALKTELPKLFVKTIDYSNYNQEIIFENNIRGTVTTGLLGYAKQILLLKTIGHLKFAYVKLEVLKITMNPEDNSVKVRWRIVGIPGYKVFVRFWKYKFWKITEALQDLDAWYDGFSTFYVGSDGKIYKHVADKMMPDQDTVLPKNKPEMIALFSGIENLKQHFPDASTTFSNLNNFIFQSGQKDTFLEKAMLKMK